MRIALAAALTVAALSFSANPSHAEAPWCAIIGLGPGSVYEDCQYSSFERCRQNVLAGNRGFCNPNPRYVATQPTGKRKRQVQSY